jgi:hypothetical protein
MTDPKEPLREVAFFRPTENLQYGKITKDTKTETENRCHTFSLCGLCELSVL